MGIDNWRGTFVKTANDSDTKFIFQETNRFEYIVVKIKWKLKFFSNKYFLIISVILGLLQLVNAQNTKSVFLDNADCINAVQIKDTVFGPYNIFEGHGQIWDIKTTEENKNHYFKEEHNSAWYWFLPTANAELEFSLVPNFPNQDIDFLLFEYNDLKKACLAIKNNILLPVRNNISRGNSKIKGVTGLSNIYNHQFVGSGIGDEYSSALKVSPQKKYLLIVNLLKTNDLTFTIFFKYKQDIIKEKSFDTSQETINKPKIELNISVKEKGSNKPINVDLKIENILDNEPVLVENTNKYLFAVKRKQTYIVQCVYKGFLVYSKKIEITDNSRQLNMDIELEPISSGAKFQLNSIRFKARTDHIISSSEKELNALLQFMNKNPSVVIEIQGHVNAPGLKNNRKVLSISTSRAKAVRQYLLDNKIDKKRVKTVGKGNSQMIYPHPETNEEEKANRRVEILILKK